MVHLFKSSSEDQVKIFRKPEQKVVALTNFNEGKLQLVGLTQNVNLLCLAEAIPENSTSIDLGVAFETVAGKPVNIVAKPGLTFPKDKTNTSESFLVSYWAVKQVFDTRLVNMEKGIKSVTVKVGSESMLINVPIFTNTSKIKAGEELFVFKVGPADTSGDDEPSSKRARKVKGKGKAQPKKK